MLQSRLYPYVYCIDHLRLFDEYIMTMMTMTTIDGERERTVE